MAVPSIPAVAARVPHRVTATDTTSPECPLGDGVQYYVVLQAQHTAGRPIRSESCARWQVYGKAPGSQHANVSKVECMPKSKQVG